MALSQHKSLLCIEAKQEYQSVYLGQSQDHQLPLLLTP